MLPILCIPANTRGEYLCCFLALARHPFPPAQKVQAEDTAQTFDFWENLWAQRPAPVSVVPKKFLVICSVFAERIGRCFELAGMEGDRHAEQNQGESLICGLTAECNTELKNHLGGK